MAAGILSWFGVKGGKLLAALRTADSIPALGVALFDQAGAIINSGNPLPVTSNGGTSLADLVAGDYETVAASQSNQAMGATGAAGDYLAGVLIVPTTTAAGAVTIKDGGNTAITIFPGGGTTALVTLIPFFVPLGIKSTSGAWQITTGANVTAIGVGNFS